MEDNINVAREFKKKNKELFDNKIVIDLEKAMDSFEVFYKLHCDTVAGLEVVNKINSFLDNKDDTSKETVKTLVNNFFKMFKDQLEEILNKRKEAIENDMQNINSSNYEKRLINESLIIANQVSDFYNEKIYELIDALKDNIKEHQLDLEDYLLSGLYVRLMNTLRDKSIYYFKLICNNYDENTAKYQSMNEKMSQKSV